MLLGKDAIEVLASKAVIDSSISQEEFVLESNVLQDKKFKISKLLWNILINMVYISRETYKRHDLKTIVDSNGLLQLNEKYIEELCHRLQ